MTTLSPITTKPREANIDKWCTADGEWIPGKPNKLRMFGLYSRKGGYRWYRTIEEWLSTEPRGREYLWHAGGRADSGFLIPYFVKNGIEAKIAPIHGSMAHIEACGSKWDDTLPLLRSSLGDIGKLIGKPKLKSPEWDCPIDELVEYNRVDCEVLFEAMEILAAQVAKMGGSWKRTIPAMSMDYFRRNFQTVSISSPPQIWPEIMEAYKASMVEIYHYGIPPTSKTVSKYDINASFPASMRGFLPCTYKGRGRFKPPNTIGFARAKVTVSNKTDKPFLPYRFNGTVYFPTGTWEGWFYEDEIEYANSIGVKIDIREWLLFDRFQDLDRFANTVFDIRSKSSGYEKYIWKLFQNGNYGKWAEQEEKEELYVNKRPDGAKQVGKGIYKKEIISKVPHRHPHVSAAITAKSRILLHQLMMRASEVYSVDTDAFATPDSDFSQSNLLGGLKLEDIAPGRECFFLAPKVYRMGDTVKAKGFPGISRLMSQIKSEDNPEKKSELIDRVKRAFDSLVCGDEHKWEHNTRISVLVKGVEYSSEEYKRRILGLSYKRCVRFDGSTRPWSVEEIRTGAPHTSIVVPGWKENRP